VRWSDWYALSASMQLFSVSGVAEFALRSVVGKECDSHLTTRDDK